jgi:hypothetical protein
VLLTVSPVSVFATRVLASNPNLDFGAYITDQLSAHSPQLFGFRHPLSESALGPYDGADNTQAIQLADGLRATLVSNSVASAADRGEEAFVNIQHRAVNDGLGKENHGALLKISGFKVNR